MEQQISDAELGIMKIIWANGGPALFTSIMEELAVRGKTRQKNTAIMLLSRLTDEGYLKAKKIRRRNEYTALISESEYRTAQTRDLLNKVYEGNTKGPVSTLTQSGLLTDEEYGELKAMLEGGNRADE